MLLGWCSILCFWPTILAEIRLANQTACINVNSDESVLLIITGNYPSRTMNGDFLLRNICQQSKQIIIRTQIVATDKPAVDVQSAIHGTINHLILLTDDTRDIHPNIIHRTNVRMSVILWERSFETAFGFNAGVVGVYRRIAVAERHTALTVVTIDEKAQWTRYEVEPKSCSKSQIVLRRDCGKNQNVTIERKIDLAVRNECSLKCLLFRNAPFAYRVNSVEYRGIEFYLLQSLAEHFHLQVNIDFVDVRWNQSQYFQKR